MVSTAELEQMVSTAELEQLLVGMAEMAHGGGASAGGAVNMVVPV